MTMTTDTYLEALRRKLSATDEGTSAITDTELLDASEDARRQLAVRKVLLVYETLAINSVTDTAGYGISPAMADDTAQLLLLKTAVTILQATYVGRLSRGEIGTSWTSGLEAESTISADKSYRALIQGLQDELDELSLIVRSKTSGVRIQ